MGELENSKTLDLAKTSIFFQGTEYFKNSTLHGVRYITEIGRPFLDKFIWICCTAMGATVTLIIIVSLWEKFQTNPTITGLDTDFHNWDVAFPSISICQDDPINYVRLRKLIESNYSDFEEPELLEEYFRALGSLRSQAVDEIVEFTNETAPLPTTNLKEIAKAVVNRQEDILSNCNWKGDVVNCNEIFFPYFTEEGFCFGYNVNPSQGLFEWDGKEVPKFKQQYIYETDTKWSFEFSVANATDIPVFVYIHSSNEQPGLDLAAHHNWDERIAKLSFSVMQTYTKEDASQLSIKQRKCVFPNEIKIRNEETYTFGGCMRECRIQNIMKKCNCIPYYYKGSKETPYCTLQEFKCLLEFNEEVTRKDPCRCELCCDNTVYMVEKLLEGNAAVPKLEIAFVSWPIVRYKREVLFGWVDLLVSFGGIAGLFLGFSLLSGVEIIYYFTVRALCMVVREKNTLENLKKEYEMAEKPPLDLSLTPYFMRPESKKRHTSPVTRVMVQPYY